MGIIGDAEAKGHKLRRDEDGCVDHFVCDVGHHNGPGCAVCHDSWCEHCYTGAPNYIRPCDGGVGHAAYVEARDRAEYDRLKEKYGS